MLAIIGMIVVFAAVLGGFLLEKGNPWVLMQPAELLIVGGAAGGIMMVANSPAVMKKMAHGAWQSLRPSKFTRQYFTINLRMLYEVFSYVQRAGVQGAEEDIEQPEKSRIFSRYPDFLANTALRDFLCDSLRMMVIGVTTPAELDRLMAVDNDVQRRGHHQPAGALASLADSLPGLGIVAAVLGVVITMESIGSSPEEVGQKVAAALVGTFLGILLCYGVVGPVASRLEAAAEMQFQFFHVVRTAVAAFAGGASPILAAEYARRSIPVELRPSFLELESTIRRDAQVPAVNQAEGDGANVQQQQPVGV
jgi:chemotaxis protein MotA